MVTVEVRVSSRRGQFCMKRTIWLQIISLVRGLIRYFFSIPPCRLYCARVCGVCMAEGDQLQRGPTCGGSGGGAGRPGSELSGGERQRTRYERLGPQGLRYVLPHAGAGKTALQFMVLLFVMADRWIYRYRRRSRNSSIIVEDFISKGRVC